MKRPDVNADLLAALKNTLDALYNETATSVDTAWIQTVKATAKDAIRKAEKL